MRALRPAQILRQSGRRRSCGIDPLAEAQLQLARQPALAPSLPQLTDERAHSVQNASNSGEFPVIRPPDYTRAVSVDSLLELALGAARDAGSLLLERFGRPVSGVESKSSSTDMVSDADRAAERLVLDRISAERPDDGVVAEESGRAAGSSGLVWVVDPLDGTTNYLFSYPVWAVSIACEDADGGVVAVVHDPCRGETFAAVRGRGATLNGRPVHTRRPRGLDRALVGTGFAYGPADRAFQATVLTHVLRRGARYPPRRLGRARPGLGRVRATRRVLRVGHQALGPGGRDAARLRGGRTGVGVRSRRAGSTRAWSQPRRICTTRCAAW